MMPPAKEMVELLAKEFGIKTEKELDEAIKKMKKLDIGIFTAPIPKGDK